MVVVLFASKDSRGSWRFAWSYDPDNKEQHLPGGELNVVDCEKALVALIYKQQDQTRNAQVRARLSLKV